MKITAGNLLLVAGLGLLVYTGYQAMTYRETLRLAQQEFDGLPPQLLWLLVASVATSLIGGLQTSGSLKLISLADAPQPTVLRPQVIDFVTFDRRGPLLTALTRKNSTQNQSNSTGSMVTS